MGLPDVLRESTVTPPGIVEFDMLRLKSEVCWVGLRLFGRLRLTVAALYPVPPALDTGVEVELSTAEKLPKQGTRLRG